MHFTYQALAVVENTFTRLPSQNHIQLDGFLTAEFDHTGKCTTFREWWHRKETDNKATSE